MQWLPTYMARNLGANKHDIMFTAIPYLLNSVIGVSKCCTGCFWLSTLCYYNNAGGTVNCALPLAIFV